MRPAVQRAESLKAMENIVYRQQIPTPRQFNNLTESVGWGTRDEKTVEKALSNSLYCLCAFDGEEIVGFARIIGDETIFLYIQDVMVRPEYQGRGIGRGIMQKLMEQIGRYCQVNPRIRTYLGADKGKEGFYRKLGFDTRADAGLGPGMVMIGRPCCNKP